MDVFLKSEKEKRTLHKAVLKGDLEKVRKMIADGIDVNAKNSKGQTALHLAAKEGHTEIVALLLEASVEVDVKDKSTRTALHYAGAANHLEIAKLLITAGADLEAVEPKHEGTVLMLAVEEGYLDMTRLFLNEGADLNVACAVGWTALHAATDPVIVRLLLEQGASPHAKDKWGKKPVSYAKGEIADMLKEAMENYDKESGFLVSSYSFEGYAPILHYAAKGDIGEVRKLLSSGTDVDVRYDTPRDKGVTALMIAAGSSQEDMCRFLLEQGADPRATTTERREVYTSSKAKGYDRKRNAERKKRKWYTHSVLETATQVSHLGIVKLLVEAGAPVNPTEKFASIPLLSTILFGSHSEEASKSAAEIVKYLIAQGADVNRAEDVQQWTALHMAAYSGHVEVAKMLLEAGADLETREINEFTPVIMAAFHRSYDVFKLYRDAGADLTARNEFGKSALDIAKEDPNCPIVIE